jgi:lantibiotic modifying enzyme
MIKRAAPSFGGDGAERESNSSLKVIRDALAGVEQGWPAFIDTMCCGTLGSIEFYCEAGAMLERSDLRDIAAQRLMAVIESADAAGDYRFNVGNRQFNPGLFRGVAGVGYTCLRQFDRSLPNVLIWE